MAGVQHVEATAGSNYEATGPSYRSSGGSRIGRRGHGDWVQTDDRIMPGKCRRTTCRIAASSPPATKARASATARSTAVTTHALGQGEHSAGRKLVACSARVAVDGNGGTTVGADPPSVTTAPSRPAVTAVLHPSRAVRLRASATTSGNRSGGGPA